MEKPANIIGRLRGRVLFRPSALLVVLAICGGLLLGGCARQDSPPARTSESETSGSTTPDTSPTDPTGDTDDTGAGTDESDPYALDCHAEVNGLKFDYPCSSEKPNVSASEHTLTTWYNRGDVVSTERQAFRVVRDSTSDTARVWAEQHPNVGAQIRAASSTEITISGWPAIRYELPEPGIYKDNTHWVVVIREDDSPVEQPIFLVAYTASSVDPKLKAAYAAQLHAMANSLNLSGALP